MSGFSTPGFLSQQYVSSICFISWPGTHLQGRGPEAASSHEGGVDYSYLGLACNGAGGRHILEAVDPRFAPASSWRATLLMLG